MVPVVHDFFQTQLTFSLSTCKLDLCWQKNIFRESNMAFLFHASFKVFTTSKLSSLKFFTKLSRSKS